MATTIEKFDSAGGFSVEKTIHIDELHNAKELNSLKLKTLNLLIATQQHIS